MKLKLVQKRLEAKGTKSFFFDPEEKISWLPGQFYYFTLPKLLFPDSKGATRHFTISASPTEGKLISFTTRMREDSGFKKTLDKMDEGAFVEGEGPSGTFIIDQAQEDPQIFLAGGIGITPYRSIIKNALDRKLKTPFYLIYSDSTKKDAAFLAEISSWASKYPQLKSEFVETASKGRLDEEKITKFLQKWNLEIGTCNFWISGPPAMVATLQKVLVKMGVHASKIRSEEFTGY